MVYPRLTGMEFSWFTKCQMLASNYEQHWGMNLEPELERLVQSVAANARASFTGPQSMKRVAERLVLAADAITAECDDQTSGTNGQRERVRCAEALRGLSARLLSTAVDVEAWKHSAPSSLATGPDPSGNSP